MNEAPSDNSLDALTALGFTRLEAEVYTLLLRESPVTGYRVAQALGKPAANVYKAIESLENKGAVLVDDGESRMCRALPAEELLRQMERGFQERKNQAARALAELRHSGEDDRVYQLKSREQVFERCRNMLARCKKLALLDAFPDPLEELRPDIEAAAARGVQVTVKAFLPTEVAGAEVVLNPRGQAVMDLYPGHWLIALVDGAELLVASLTPDRRGIHQAIWSESVTLAYIYHASFAAEIILASVFSHIDRGATEEEIRAAILPFVRENVTFEPEKAGAVGEALRRYANFYAKDLPGYQLLIERFGPPVSPASE
jgi:sugar-specific transcriptional regulator TrmB